MRFVVFLARVFFVRGSLASVAVGSAFAWRATAAALVALPAATCAGGIGNFARYRFHVSWLMDDGPTIFTSDGAGGGEAVVVSKIQCCVGFDEQIRSEKAVVSEGQFHER